MTAPYRFGDGEVAAERLAILAELFDPTSRAFVERSAPPRPGLVVDLGCGPGHTTAMLANATGARRTIGIDASADYVARATAQQPGPGVEFVRHDVTVVPFPCGPADVIYARYLLAHLPDPDAVIDRWTTQLRPGGVLLLDETEGIETDVDVFRTYLDLVVDVLAADGVDMYAGRLLADRSDDTAEVSLPVAAVARMFSLNLSVWRHAPYIVEQVPTSVVDDLAAALDALAAGGAVGGGAVGTITWRMRRAAVPSRPCR